MRDRNDPGSGEMFPWTKRGRGRPKVENKLTPAERASRYRERKREESETQVADLAAEIRRLRRELKAATGGVKPAGRKRSK